MKPIQDTIQVAVANSGDASDRTASNWLKKMQQAGVIESVGYGNWRKKLNLISEEQGGGISQLHSSSNNSVSMKE